MVHSGMIIGCGFEWRWGVGGAADLRASRPSGDRQHPDRRRGGEAVAGAGPRGVSGGVVGVQLRRRPASLVTRSARLGTLKPQTLNPSMLYHANI